MLGSVSTIGLELTTPEVYWEVKPRCYGCMYDLYVG